MISLKLNTLMIKGVAPKEAIDADLSFIIKKGAIEKIFIRTKFN